MDQRRPSITDFLTDGSLAALCAFLGPLAGATITLHDDQGRRIRHTNAEPNWLLDPDSPESHHIAHLIRARRASPSVLPLDGRLVEPIEVAGVTIGALLIEADPLRTSDSGLDRLRQIVHLLVSTVNELCEQDVLLRQRNAELSILFRLSSLLVAARDLSTILQVALRSALEILAVDAGAVFLLNDDKAGYSLAAHAGLSPAFLNAAPPPNPPGLEPRAPRDAASNALAAEGLASVISGSMSFGGRHLGVVRFFTRDERYLDPAEQALLQTIIEQVAAAVASAKFIESESKARQVRRQLRLAADVQRRMLPSAPPTFPRLDVAARYLPSFDLGGDFYDLIELNGHLGIVVGDVAGKGVPAALLMAAVRASLRAHATDVYHLDDVMARVNRAMARDTLPQEFATVFYGVIDPASLRLTYCNAGHDPPLLIHLSPRAPADAPPNPAAPAAPTDRDIFELNVGGMVIGVDAEQTYQRGMFDLAPGDTLVAYTDGVVDAQNFDNARFGRPRLRASILSRLAAEPAVSAQALVDHIVWDVRRYVGLKDAIDDQTLVVLRVR